MLFSTLKKHLFLFLPALGAGGSFKGFLMDIFLENRG